MKLTLSKEKTLITDVRRKRACFLGYEFKVVKGKGEHGYVTRTRPDEERLKKKVDAITDDIKKIPRDTSREKLVDEINRINSRIRGVVQYYQCCTWVSVSMDKYGRKYSGLLVGACNSMAVNGFLLTKRRIFQEYTKATV